MTGAAWLHRVKPVSVSLLVEMEDDFLAGEAGAGQFHSGLSTSL